MVSPAGAHRGEVGGGLEEAFGGHVDFLLYVLDDGLEEVVRGGARRYGGRRVGGFFGRGWHGGWWGGGGVAQSE